jgi:hypothetical protein
MYWLMRSPAKNFGTPADVVDASGGQMSTDEAAQWLLNEQYRLDQSVSKIKDEARQIAETTLNFKRDATSAVAKYEPLFAKYPTLQEKVYNQLMKQVKVDKEKGVILSAPDVMEHYDFYLEPYQKAFEFANNTPATNPVPLRQMSHQSHPPRTAWMRVAMAGPARHQTTQMILPNKLKKN